MGKKARQVVKVDVNTGAAISEVPSMAASRRDLPMVPWRKMFSTITMPLSISIPNARIRLNNTTIFSVTPISCSTVKERSMEKGMANATKREFIKPIKMIVMSKTSKKPLNILFSKSEMISRISSD